MSSANDITRLILDHNDFLVTSHTHPDGDSIGSQLAFASVLKDLGKRVLIADHDPLPKRYQFLSGSAGVMNSIPNGYTCDVVFVLDSASLARIGSILDQIPVKDVIIANIDHHVSNDRFGQVVYVKPDRSSTSEIVLELIKNMGVEITAQIAEQLYAGILTDTGSFQHPNTTFDSFLASASLVKNGADPCRIAAALFSENPVSRMRLLGLALSNIEMTDDICCLTLTKEMVLLSGASMDESEDFVDFPLSLSGVKIGLLFREQDDGRVRVSFRSKDQIDVDEIARIFGGGGHEAASGCIIDGEIEKIRKQVVEEVVRKLQERKGRKP
jgi:phosphoesterase RecJ-like protein